MAQILEKVAKQQKKKKQKRESEQRERHEANSSAELPHSVSSSSKPKTHKHKSHKHSHHSVAPSEAPSVATSYAEQLLDDNASVATSMTEPLFTPPMVHSPTRTASHYSFASSAETVLHINPGSLTDFLSASHHKNTKTHSSIPTSSPPPSPTQSIKSHTSTFTQSTYQPSLATTVPLSIPPPQGSYLLRLLEDDQSPQDTQVQCAQPPNPHIPYCTSQQDISITTVSSIGSAHSSPTDSGHIGIRTDDGSNVNVNATEVDDKHVNLVGMGSKLKPLIVGEDSQQSETSQLGKCGADSPHSLPSGGASVPSNHTSTTPGQTVEAVTHAAPSPVVQPTMSTFEQDQMVLDRLTALQMQREEQERFRQEQAAKFVSSARDKVAMDEDLEPEEFPFSHMNVDGHFVSSASSGSLTPTNSQSSSGSSSSGSSNTTTGSYYSSSSSGGTSSSSGNTFSLGGVPGVPPPPHLGGHTGYDGYPGHPRMGGSYYNMDTDDGDNLMQRVNDLEMRLGETIQYTRSVYDIANTEIGDRRILGIAHTHTMSRVDELEKRVFDLSQTVDKHTVTIQKLSDAAVLAEKRHSINTAELQSQLSKVSSKLKNFEEATDKKLGNAFTAYTDLLNKSERHFQECSRIERIAQEALNHAQHWNTLEGAAELRDFVVKIGEVQVRGFFSRVSEMLKAFMAELSAQHHAHSHSSSSSPPPTSPPQHPTPNYPHAPHLPSPPPHTSHHTQQVDVGKGKTDEKSTPQVAHTGFGHHHQHHKHHHSLHLLLPLPQILLYIILPLFLTTPHLCLLHLPWHRTHLVVFLMLVFPFLVLPPPLNLFCLPIPTLMLT